MVNGYNSLYKDYEILLIKNDKLSKEVRDLKYMYNLLDRQNKMLERNNQKIETEILEKQNVIKELEYENARLRALLNMDGTNHGIPTSETPINKEKVIPNTREKTNKPKGGQIGHQKHKLEKFKDNELRVYLHIMHLLILLFLILVP